jgi:hypothetical protein
MPLSDEQRKANRRLAWVLASLAAAFAAGFVVRMTWFGF